MDKPFFRLAHFSDPHFTCYPSSLKEWCTKRFWGVLNFIFTRKRDHDVQLIDALLPLLRTYKVDALVITGDLTSYSLHAEFKKATQLYKKLATFPFPSFIIPGNHDCYTKKAEQEHLFYQYFPYCLPSAHPSFSLAKDRIAFGSFSQALWWIALDTAVSTPCFEIGRAHV